MKNVVRRDKGEENRHPLGSCRCINGVASLLMERSNLFNFIINVKIFTLSRGHFKTISPCFCLNAKLSSEKSRVSCTILLFEQGFMVLFRRARFLEFMTSTLTTKFVTLRSTEITLWPTCVALSGLFEKLAKLGCTTILFSR